MLAIHIFVPRGAYDAFRTCCPFPTIAFVVSRDGLGDFSSLVLYRREDKVTVVKVLIEPIHLLVGVMDNYSYVISSPESQTRDCVVLDPAEGEPIIEFLRERKLVLRQIWITHHHYDHVWGLQELMAAYPQVEVFGGRYDQEQGRVKGVTRVVDHGDVFEFLSLPVRVLETPGHTLGAVSFLLNGEELFPGDALFLGGCGRVFEGTMSMMASTLKSFLDLPPSTRLWCGHEYTVSNLRFALSVEPDNEDIRAALRSAEARREKGLPTVPDTLAHQARVNPFLRFDQQPLLGDDDPVSAFERLRTAKDNFRGV